MSEELLKQWSVSKRPPTLDDFLGSQQLISQVEKVIKTRKYHAILITGPTGCGKTTLAKIIGYAIAKIEYGEKHPDIFEGNIGADGGKEDIRKLIEASQFMPHTKDGRKVFILDECFPPDTLILLANGSTATIEAISLEPDKYIVMSFNHTTQEVEAMPVISGSSKMVEERVRVTLEDGSSQVCSKDHLWWSITRNQYVKACDLTSQDDVLQFKPIVEG